MRYDSFHRRPPSILSTRTIIMIDNVIVPIHNEPREDVDRSLVQYPMGTHVKRIKGRTRFSLRCMRGSSSRQGRGPYTAETSVRILAPRTIQWARRCANSGEPVSSTSGLGPSVSDRSGYSRYGPDFPSARHNPPKCRIGPAMNNLPRDKQIDIIAALSEGMSIRAVERLTGVHRDTIMRLGARVGRGCAELHDRMFVGIRAPRMECDEFWAFVGCKQRNVTRKDVPVKGDQYRLSRSRLRPRRSWPIAPASATARIRTCLFAIFANGCLARLRFRRTAFTLTARRSAMRSVTAWRMASSTKPIQ